MENTETSLQDNLNPTSLVKRLIVRTDKGNLEDAILAESIIPGLVYQRVEYIPEIVKNLIETREEINESNRVKKVSNLLGVGSLDNLINHTISSQIITDTILKISENSISYLDKTGENHNKFLASKIRTIVKEEKRKKKFKAILQT